MITIAVEGASDRAAARAVVEYAGRQVRREYVLRGKSRLDDSLPGYIRASEHSPSWVVFRDSDGECPVAIREKYFPHGQEERSTFALRIAHTMTEAWLLGDRENFAAYFSVSPGLLPLDPEAETHAKRTLLNICARSRSRRIRESVVTSDRLTGPLYVSIIDDFARTAWSVGAATENSQSLSRAIAQIRGLE